MRHSGRDGIEERIDDSTQVLVNEGDRDLLFLTHNDDVNCEDLITVAFWCLSVVTGR
jgi:hypothetical protein